MNIYALVEGKRTEKVIYRSWLTSCLSGMQLADRIEDLTGNHLFIVSGGGYPCILNRIHAAIEDAIAHGDVDCLLICVDSEEQSYQERYDEILAWVRKGRAFDRIEIIVQHCCIETWLLGNSHIVKRNPGDEILRNFLRIHDVRTEDPESSPLADNFTTRAQFHEQYLRSIFRERHQVYTKCDPGEACKPYYLAELVRRNHGTGHIASFGVFWRTMAKHGAVLPVTSGI